MSSISTLCGKDLGYVVEVKVLKGRFGKADVYVPSIDLIIQVDGEHHNMPHQLSVDARFNAEGVSQSRRVLRLYYKDVSSFRSAIHNAVHSCITDPTAAWAVCSSQHPAKNMMMPS
jgi:very-short-patch-repair endonuclease